MIIQKHYKYEEFQIYLQSIRDLPPLDGNKFIFTNVENRKGERRIIIFEYRKYSQCWDYTSLEVGEEQ